MKRILFDSNVYDLLAEDGDVCMMITKLTEEGTVAVVATPIIEDELRESPFGDVPDWFPVDMQSDAVFVMGYAKVGRAFLSSGEVYAEHRGASNSIRDAILAESADSIADIFVSEDRRCRRRLDKISQTCQGLSYLDFRSWLTDKCERSIKMRSSTNR